MGFLQTCVFLTAVVALVKVSGQAVDICDICKCETVQGEVKTVLCDCNTQNKEINITEDKMAKVVHIINFGVSNCTSVNFHKSAFKAAHDLRSVTVSRVNTVVISMGVFSSLSSLLVEDVSDLQLAKMAFLGATVTEIVIHRSNISVLHDLVLYDVVGLNKFELNGVIVGRIKTAAINVVMTEYAQFVISGCEVGMIERGAVNVQTYQLFISKSVFDEIKNQAVNVTATQNINVMKNLFGANCSSNGLVVASPIITVDQNTFSYLPIGLLKKSAGASSRVSFTKNVVYNFTLMYGGVDLSTMLHLDQFKNNEVWCDCEIAKSVWAYKVFQETSAPLTIVEENFCHLPSACRLSLQSLSEAQEQVCQNDTTATINQLCENLPAENPSPQTTISFYSTRGGRMEEPPTTPESSTTTTTTTTTTTIRPSRQHAVSAGTTFSFRTVLTTLAVVAASAKRLLI